jgi:hypothetical protein
VQIRRLVWQPLSLGVAAHTSRARPSRAPINCLGPGDGLFSGL